MSNRSLIELNHAYCPYKEEELMKWAKAMRLYLSSGERKFLPNGARLLGYRHHSDPEFKVEP